jgi:hypothetical protein
MDATHSKKSREKHFAPWHGPAQCDMHFEMRSRKYIHMLSFVYEDGIKIKNKYFATVYELHICPIKPSAGLPSLMRLSL